MDKRGSVSTLLRQDPRRRQQGAAEALGAAYAVLRGDYLELCGAALREAASLLAGHGGRADCPAVRAAPSSSVRSDELGRGAGGAGAGGAAAPTGALRCLRRSEQRRVPCWSARPGGALSLCAEPLAGR